MTVLTLVLALVVFVALIVRLLEHLAAFIRKPGVVSTVNIICTGALLLLTSYALDATVEKLKHLL